MRKLVLFASLVVVGLLAVAATMAFATGSGGKKFSAKLNGYNEVTSKSTVARGTFTATVVGNEIHYRLSYSNLETPALFAHVHFSQPHVNGGISFFLCGGSPPQSDKPACPPTSGTVTGVIDAADIIGPGEPGPNDQGIEPGSLSEAIRAMRAGATYANVHSQRFPGGEVRGQIKVD